MKNNTEELSPLPIHLLILREELARRISNNPRYSLRSFAKRLDIDPSLLSKILNNLRPMSKSMATKILKNIELADAERNLFLKSLMEMKSENFSHAMTATSQQEKLLEQNLFKTIAEPHHYALVELSRIKSFKSDLNWISQFLGISKEETHAAIDRLVAIGMLQRNGDQIERASGRFTTKDKTVTNSAYRYHQRKILEQAITALELVPIEQRNQSSMTIAINPKKIPIAKKMIQEFINELSDVLETGSLEEVYQISLSLFPVSIQEHSEAKV